MPRYISRSIFPISWDHPGTVKFFSLIFVVNCGNIDWIMVQSWLEKMWMEMREKTKTKLLKI